MVLLVCLNVQASIFRLSLAKNESAFFGENFLGNRAKRTFQKTSFSNHFRPLSSATSSGDIFSLVFPWPRKKREEIFVKNYWASNWQRQS